jgi:hypothetical protein
MQAFSGMQRNRARQTSLLTFFLVIGYVGYVGLSSVYLLLPPLFGLLFVLFIRALDRDDFFTLILISLMLMLYEVEKGYLLISSLVFFGLVYQFAVPKLRQYIDCQWCLTLIYILIAYFGFWIFSLMMSKIFWMEAPAIDWHIMVYVLFEFIVAVLL